MPTNVCEIKKRESAISSLKELLVIITGLTLTNAVVILITGGNYQAIRPLNHIPLMEAALFGLLLINLIRFYHGNVRLLDDSYMLKERNSIHTAEEHSDSRINHIHWDFIVILLTGIMFVFMGFYLEDYASFFFIFTSVLVIDVTWYFFTTKGTRDLRIQKQRKQWAFNNVAHLLVFIPIVTIEIHSWSLSSEAKTVRQEHDIYMFVVLGILVLTNAIADFYISWDFYFPSENNELNGGCE